MLVENTLRHALWAWAIFHRGWSLDAAEEEAQALDFFQERGLDVFSGSLDALVAAALESAKGDLTIGVFEGAPRLQAVRAGDRLVFVVSIRRAGRWRGLGAVDSLEVAVAQILGRRRPSLRLIEGG